jgi:hypothetical protein
MATSPRAADVTAARSRRRVTREQPSFTESRPEARAASGQSADQASGPSADQIAQRAYELYCARGRSDGSDMDDWFAAERELTGGAVSAGNTAAAQRDVNSDEAA